MPPKTRLSRCDQPVAGQRQAGAGSRTLYGRDHWLFAVLHGSDQVVQPFQQRMPLLDRQIAACGRLGQVAARAEMAAFAGENTAPTVASGIL